MTTKIEGPDLMTPAEVAALFRVSPTTVSRWANAGKFPEGTAILTPGGTHRFKRDGVQAMLNGGRP